MTTDPDSPWFQRGAEARGAARPRTENPLLAPGEMPEITGEAFALWCLNRDLWWEGWEAEDRRLSARPQNATERRSR